MNQLAFLLLSKPHLLPGKQRRHEFTEARKRAFARAWNIRRKNHIQNGVRTRKLVISVIKANSGVSNKFIAETLGIGARYVGYITETLRAEGLIRRVEPKVRVSGGQPKLWVIV